MILPLVLAAQATTTAAPWAPANQLTCALVVGKETGPTSLDLDLATRRLGNAAIVAAPGSVFGRVSSATLAMTPAGQHAPMRMIGFATGAGQYRLDLSQVGEATLARIVAVAEGLPSATIAQGFCGTRAGKPLKVKPTAMLAMTDRPAASPAWQLRTFAGMLPAGRCTMVDTERRARTLSYTVAGGTGNEIALVYRADDTALLGAYTANASGTRFSLAAPNRRMVSVTTLLAGTAPPAYVHLAFEPAATWADVTRGGQIVAVGACGAPLPALADQSSGASQP